MPQRCSVICTEEAVYVILSASASNLVMLKTTTAWHMFRKLCWTSVALTLWLCENAVRKTEPVATFKTKWKVGGAKPSYPQASVVTT